MGPVGGDFRSAETIKHENMFKKIREPNNQSFAFSRYEGVYFVRYYDDGTITGLMTKSIAKDYAEIFGGKVYKHSRARKWWQFWKPLLNAQPEKNHD